MTRWLLILFFSCSAVFATSSEQHKSAQNIVFRAKELANERGGHIRIAASLDDAYRQNLQTLQSFESDGIIRRTVLPHLLMILFETKRNAPSSQVLNIVRSIQSIPGATVEVDSVITLSEELKDIKIYNRNTLEPPDDPLFPSLWGLKDIKAIETWALLSNKKAFYRPKVVLIGTGVDYTHADLLDNMWTNLVEDSGTEGFDDDGNGYTDDIHGWNTITEDGNPLDYNGHGTFIAGIIAATANNGIGGVGVTPVADIVPCKFITSAGWGYLMDAIKCIDYAIAVGADIISNSWASDTIQSSILVTALDTARQRHDHIFITPAGFAGQNITDQPFYPAAADTPNLVSVAAVGSSNRLLRDSNYSKFGVDIGAPGEGVKSLSISSLEKCTMGSGGSVSAAYVVGVAAMMKMTQPTATSEDIKHALKSSVSPFYNSANLVAWNGKVNALGAVTAIQASSH